MNKIIKKFIVFEGLDNSGKTTQSILLKDRLETRGYKVFLQAEPTPSSVGKMIREALKSKELDQEYIARLFALDRFMHIYTDENSIISSAKDGIVISDRYLFSSLAYQSLALPFDFVLSLNKNFPLPEYLFYLDIGYECYAKRLALQQEAPDFFEKKEFVQNVKVGYEKAFLQFENNVEKMKIFKINSEQSKEEIIDEIYSKLEI